MQEDYFENYKEQARAQIDLIRCRYEFGLNRAEILLSAEDEISKLTWVDIGSNLGVGVSSISPEANIIATDLDKRYLESFDDPFVSKVNLDATFLPFANNSSDIISCFETIEHIPMNDIGKMLIEINRVLKEDGILLISTPNREANGKAKMSPDHKQEFTYTEFHMLLKSYGFAIEEEYGQNFLKDNNLLHQAFRSLRENFFIRNIYNRLPSFIVKTVKNTTINAFGNGEIRKKQNREIERIMYFVCKKIA